MANTISARFSLDGFSLNLLPRMENNQGQASLNPSGFTPRIGVYTGDPASPEYRGEIAFNFSNIPTEPEDGVHKGLKSKDELFASPEMASVLAAWLDTSAGILDDTPDGSNAVGSGSLDYRMELIEATLKYSNLVDNNVLIEFGIYESAKSKTRFSTVVVRYVPDDLVEVQRAASRNLKKNLADAKKEIQEASIAIGKLNSSALDFEVQRDALIMRIQGAQNRIQQQSEQLATRYNILYFPLSKLFEEPAVKQAIGTMVAGVFSELKQCTYLMESYDLSSLASMDLDSLLTLFAKMRAE